jgi:hypothetical protein
MPEGAWTGILGVVIGVIVATVGYLSASYIKYSYMKPNLEILSDEPHESTDLVHHSIRIKNKGKNVARDCNAVLTVLNMSISDIIDGPAAYLKTNAYRPIRDESLCWAFQILGSDGKPINPALLSIFPQSTRFVELCRVLRQSLLIEIPSEMGWKIKRVVLRGNKEYEIELKVFAENVSYDHKKHRAKFKLIPNSEKKDVDIKRLPC